MLPLTGQPQLAAQVLNKGSAEQPGRAQSCLKQPQSPPQSEAHTDAGEEVEHARAHARSATRIRPYRRQRERSLGAEPPEFKQECSHQARDGLAASAERRDLPGDGVTFK